MLNNKTDDSLYKLLKRYGSSRRPISVDFRQMACWLKYDSYTHLIHPYPAKLLKHIPHYFLANNILSKEGDMVLDPFCGSGTVLLESKLSGRRSIGSDSNPFARLLTKVKVQDISVRSLKISFEALKKRMQKEPCIQMPDVINLEYWFYPRVRKQLLCIYESTKQVNNSDCKDFFLICFSKCAKKVSLADPRLSVPVKLNPGKYNDGHRLKIAAQKQLSWLRNVDVFSVFEQIVLENIERVNELASISCSSCPSVITSDARDMVCVNKGKKIRKATADIVITSPPYTGAQKYIRSVSLNLGWLEMCNSEQLKKLKENSIGREEYKVEAYKEFVKTGIPLADRVLKKIFKEYPLRSYIASNYLNEMKDAFIEISRVLKPGGYFVLVVGDNQICRYDFHTSKFLRYILEDLGYSLELCLIDDIKSRGLMTKRNKTAGIISREWVMLFKKG